MKKKFKRSTKDERIEYLRSAMQRAVVTHGAPCMCTLCEALSLEFLAGEGEINLKTGERNG